MKIIAFSVDAQLGMLCRSIQKFGTYANIYYERRALLCHIMAHNPTPPDRLKTVTIRKDAGAKSPYLNLGERVQIYWGSPRNGGFKIGELPVASVLRGKLVVSQENIYFARSIMRSIDTDFWANEGFASRDECHQYWLAEWGIGSHPAFLIRFGDANDR